MHYNVILKRYGVDRARLLFTDTDSLCYRITTRDLYEDMKQDLHYYDTSNYPPDHPLYSITNEKVLGKFKDELKGIRGLEFVGLRPKLYSLLVDCDSKPKMAVKGIKKSYVKKNVKHEMFRNTLFTKKNSDDAKFIKFHSKLHKVTTIEQKKICLCAFDDKRYILDDGISSLAYGHKRIRELSFDTAPPCKRQKLNE